MRMKVANSKGLVKSEWPVQIGGRSTVLTRAVALTGALVTSPFFADALPALAAARCLGEMACWTSRSSVRGLEKCILGLVPAGQVARKRSSVLRISSCSGLRHQKCW